MTPKQERFVEEYLIDLNATQAAIRAGYSAKTAADIGRQLLRKTPVSDAIAAKKAARSERTEITADRVLREYAKLAFADIRKVTRWGKSPLDAEAEHADPNGLGIYPVELVPSESIDDDTAAAVAEVSLTQTGIKVKMHDKKGALDSVARHLGLFVDRSEVGSPGEFDHLTDEQAADEARRLAAIAEGTGSTGEASS